MIRYEARPHRVVGTEFKHVDVVAESRAQSTGRFSDGLWHHHRTLRKYHGVYVKFMQVRAAGPSGDARRITNCKRRPVSPRRALSSTAHDTASITLQPSSLLTLA